MSMVPSEAVINKIIPLSVVDGPGCRTSVFVQGCNIACAYCHNPETQQLCSGCGRRERCRYRKIAEKRRRKISMTA